MKKWSAALLSLALCLPLMAHAHYTGPGENDPIRTAAAVQQGEDGKPVELEGAIIRQIQGDHYEFRDATGSVSVDISRRHLPEQNFNQSNTVRIKGEVDRDVVPYEVDVKKVEILK